MIGIDIVDFDAILDISNLMRIVNRAYQHDYDGIAPRRLRKNRAD